jgi:hypothetical protein
VTRVYPRNEFVHTSRVLRLSRLAVTAPAPARAGGQSVRLQPYDLRRSTSSEPNARLKHLLAASGCDPGGLSKLIKEDHFCVQLILKSYADWPYTVRRRWTFFPFSSPKPGLIGRFGPTGGERNLIVRSAAVNRPSRRFLCNLHEPPNDPSPTLRGPPAPAYRPHLSPAPPLTSARVYAPKPGDALRHLLCRFSKVLQVATGDPDRDKTLAAVQSTAADPDRVVGTNPTNSAAGQYTRLLSPVNPSQSFSLPQGRRVNVALTLALRQPADPVQLFTRRRTIASDRKSAGDGNVLLPKG